MSDKPTYSRLLRQFPGGHLFLWTRELAKRPDMTEVDPLTAFDQSAASLALPTVDPEPQIDPEDPDEPTVDMSRPEQVPAAEPAIEPEAKSDELPVTLTPAAIRDHIEAATDKEELETWVRDQLGIELDRRYGLEKMKAAALSALEG